MASDSNNSDPMQPQSNHKKRRKIDHHSLAFVPWRSEAEQRIYSSRLVQALRRAPSSSAAAKPRAAAQVRDTANRLLAATAKGRTRWSRAILARRKKLQRLHKKARKASSSSSSSRLLATGTAGDRKRRLPALQKKARALSRLVPGCRKLSFPNLLEEATDYISALEMQVRAMTALAELLSAAAPPGLAGHSLS